MLHKQQLHLELGHFIGVALRDVRRLQKVTSFVEWTQSLALAFVWWIWQETRGREASWVGLLKETSSFHIVGKTGFVFQAQNLKSE